ncbi:uncharacterized protein ASCRUDRAFT_97643 [Ascoidea rubescens DSM 1968]|uniref:Uncharacterized protein n=1 Tax=Ascoidea rubescens DSM 1968 TaxID=1344418 RepID=A0A1D2VPU6_9ASCO|nr:hypothetical protein ASCRUDRAFT_97643 [Ascoidea rubescens DSM 1968]ODV63628.1 hypothetical protein ASCRUDRAFT_97643 [Ascoidea rubescens DSM 1968]
MNESECFLSLWFFCPGSEVLSLSPMLVQRCWTVRSACILLRLPSTALGAILEPLFWLFPSYLFSSLLHFSSLSTNTSLFFLLHQSTSAGFWCELWFRLENNRAPTGLPPSKHSQKVRLLGGPGRNTI